MKRIIIPIKTNNQRLPGKNTMMLGEKPLYQYLFDTVKLSNFNVYIDSSDKNILQIARKNGFNTIERDPSLNSPETSGNDLIYHALEKIGCDDNDIVGQFFVTTPFLKKDTIIKSFDILDQNKEKTSCFGLYPVFDRFWLDNMPLNHSKNKLVGTQYMKPLMREAGFYTFRCGAFKSECSRITKDFITFDVDKLECVDIDTSSDFLYARSLVISNGGF